VEGLVEATEGRFSIVGVFAFRVGVMDDQTKAHSAVHCGPLQHFKIAVGARTTEQNTTLTLVEDELWQDELEVPDELKQRLLIKHVNGPLFFGFVYAFRRIAERATDGKMLVLRMERVTYMDQSGIYALQDVLVDLEAAGLKVFVVGLPQDQIDQLEAMHIVPTVLSEKDFFQNFDEFKQRLPAIVEEISRTSGAGRPIKTIES
jgi:SulP family sulfate permease